MTRPLRLEYPGGVYHVTSRGNARQRIYASDTDRQGFLAILASVVNRAHWLCHAYCLMDNHYHRLIETPEANLSRGMRQLNGIYTQWFNRTHHRVGHLFQGRYKAIVVDKESHLETKNTKNRVRSCIHTLAVIIWCHVASIAHRVSRSRLSCHRPRQCASANLSE
jgi:REP element-mobilizing transposase RayT